MTEQFHRICAVEEIPANGSMPVEIEGVDVLLCHAGGEFYVVQNMCTHQRAKLEGGRIRNCFISCPLHGARFDLRDGSTKGQLTNIPLTTYAVRVVDGFVEVSVS